MMTDPIQDLIDAIGNAIDQVSNLRKWAASDDECDILVGLLATARVRVRNLRKED